LCVGLAAATMGLFRFGWEIGLIVGLSMIGIILTANLVGTVLPFVLSRLKLDPATASSPLITSIADILGLVIYFSFATFVLTTMTSQA
jgi:magnesium transporter